MENYRDDNIPTVNNTAAETTDTNEIKKFKNQRKKKKN